MREPGHPWTVPDTAFARLVCCNSATQSPPIRLARKKAFPAESDFLPEPVCGEMHQTGLMYSRRVLTGLQTADGSPPAFLRLAGDPLRWRLLSELARSDRRVTELTSLVGQPQNAVSYHLAGCAGAGWCRCGAALPMAGTATTASTWPAAGSCSPPPARRCTPAWAAPSSTTRPPPSHGGPGAGAVPLHRQQRPVPDRRSILAQAAGGRVEVASAGSHPKPLHPNAMRVMRSYGIDMTAARSKHLDEVTRTPLRLRDHLVRQGPRSLPGAPRPPGADPLEHPRPGRRGSAGRASYPAFRAVAADLHTRIGFLHRRHRATGTRREGDLS